MKSSKLRDILKNPSDQIQNPVDRVLLLLHASPEPRNARPTFSFFLSFCRSPTCPSDPRRATGLDSIFLVAPAGKVSRRQLLWCFRRPASIPPSSAAVFLPFSFPPPDRRRAQQVPATFFVPCNSCRGSTHVSSYLYFSGLQLPAVTKDATVIPSSLSVWVTLYLIYVTGVINRILTNVHVCVVTKTEGRTPGNTADTTPPQLRRSDQGGFTLRYINMCLHDYFRTCGM
ncbi:hypothetical protein LXL04_015582 [Taraxacum kok-saghyz]